MPEVLLPPGWAPLPPGWVYTPGGVAVPAGTVGGTAAAEGAVAAAAETTVAGGTAAGGTAGGATAASGSAAGGSAILGALGTAAIAVLVAEITSLVSAVSSLWLKARLQEKLDQLNDMTSQILKNIGTATNAGALTAAQAKLARDQVEASWLALSQLLNARIQECQDSLDTNILINIGEWFQDMFGSGPPHPPHKKGSAEIKVGCLKQGPFNESMGAMSNQPYAVHAAMSATALVAALDPSDNAEVLALAQARWRDASVDAPALRMVYLRIARVLSVIVESRPHEFWRKVYDTSPDDEHVRREAIAAGYRSTDDAAWELCTLALARDPSPVVRVFALEIAASMAARDAKRVADLWKLVSSVEAAKDPARRLGAVCGMALMLSDERARNFLRATAQREPNDFIRGTAFGAWAPYATERELAAMLSRSKGGAAPEPPSTGCDGKASAVATLLSGIELASRSSRT